MDMKWQKAIVTKVLDQTSDFRTLVLKPQKFIPFKSGNFVELAVNKNGAYKCYSVVSSPREIGIIEVGVKLYENGALSPKLFKLNVGDEIHMRGPTGAYFIWEPSDHETVLIAGGSGICPMISILRQYVTRAKLHVVFSTKQNSVYYKDELEKLAREKNADYFLIRTGKENRLTKAELKTRFENIIGSKTDFYVAGPTDFVQDLSLWLLELGVAPANLLTDDFGSD